ncbi:MAG: hemerythrin domain-containing protein [Magnetococcus sp. DMHC-8]
MKFHELVFTIQVDHAVIGRLLDSIALSGYRDARRKLSIVKQLLINHFLVEEFVLYPYIRKQLVNSEAGDQTSLFEQMDHRDATEVLKGMEGHNSACTHIITRVSACLNAEEEAFRALFADLSSLLRARIAFEEERLLRGVDTSRTKLLRKADFARVRIDD